MHREERFVAQVMGSRLSISFLAYGAAKSALTLIHFFAFQ